MKDDGSGRKILVHAAIGGIMSSITGAGFTSGAVGAGLNEAVIKEIDKIAKHDPGAAQIVSAISGAAAARAVGGTAEAGASAAASGTKWNKYEKAPAIKLKLIDLYETAEESIQPEKTGDRVGESVKKEPVDGKAENPPKSEKVEESTGVKADKTAQTEKTGGSVSKDASSTTGELKGSKSVDDLLEDATPGRKTKGKSTQYIKKGGYEKAKEEFDALEKVEGSVKETDKGFTAQLPDGRDVNVRNQSREGSPTLEIYNPINKRHIKIRYEQ